MLLRICKPLVAGRVAAVEGGMWFLYCGLSFLGALLMLAHGAALFYLGFACVHIWKLIGSEIVPSSIEMKGPEGQVVGHTDVV